MAFFALPLIATCYSAFMAFALAHGAPVTTNLIIAVELALLGIACILIYRGGLRPEDLPASLLLYAFVLVAITTSLMTERPMLEVLRAGLIIGIFTLVGQRLRLETLDRLFQWLSVIVLLFLLLEIAALPAYVSVFQPQQFFEATRGIATSEYNESGLFNNTSGFEGRFSFQIFDVPRTSSIFLEQISNANFAGILALYLSVRWKYLTKAAFALQVATVILILVSTNARFASLLVLGIAAGHGIFPRLPKAALPLFSLALLVAATLIFSNDPNMVSDDIQGRISYVGRRFRDADLAFFLGQEAARAVNERDSGYSYLVGTMSIFGFLAFWFFVNLVPRMDDPASRRLGWGLVAYLLGQLLVSSTSLLSIKTAALLWVLIGCVRVQRNPAIGVASPARGLVRS